jgi:membrane-associated phospholipid phosphatase
VPLNTLPSMHTAFAVLVVVFSFASWSHPLTRAAFVVPAVLIVASTLTLKEHVILDLVAGLALGAVAAAWWLHGRSRGGSRVEGSVR